MSDRELVVLGTASQMPTRRRNHNGYLLLWDAEGVLVDPGEGTQRQLVHSGVRATRINRICLTHLHGDHCLGLPGVLARLSQNTPGRRVHLHFPASGLEYVERLLTSSIMDVDLDLVLDPVAGAGTVATHDGFTVRAEQLEHSTDALGWRVEEPPRRHLRPDRLRAARLSGPDIAELVGQGHVRRDGTTTTIEEVSELDEGHSAAFVFDTRWCDGAVALARGADMLVCESTFQEVDAARAREYGHMTAQQAGELAAMAGAHLLVLTHFSGRYPDPSGFLREASSRFDRVIVAEDLMRIDVPRRTRPGLTRRHGAR